MLSGSVQLASEADSTAATIPMRLVASDVMTGQPWTAAVISAGDLWKLNPNAEIDEQSEVFFRFTVGLAEGCQLGPPQTVAFSPETRRLYPTFESLAEGCTTGPNPTTSVVAGR